ncbi:MAG: 3-deoxy-D-manno-octulosonic acid transferase [Lentisphaeria bacterium]|nr:3-deoxy-D-manno-octulosonic acid transferase [Lentisphaeria bacterium]NQZ69285.1 3-deoxy-D-manno-octulosonic acid transferase [Lentisphaeria bacterium]
MVFIAMLFYKIVFPILFFIYLPFYWRRLKKRGNFEDGFSERFGKYSPEKKAALAALKDPVWIHAVSVGETVAALSFIKTWKQDYPQQSFVLSTTTSTGQELAQKKAAADLVCIYFPLDMCHTVSRALTVIQPKQIILFEVEIWPLFIDKAVVANIPIALANARLSDNSSAGYKKHRWLFKSIFSKFSTIVMQTERDMQRLEAVTGASEKYHCVGNMKFDQIPDQDEQGPEELINKIFPSGSTLFIAASTHAPEEELICDIFNDLKKKHPSLAMILVPRHHERSAEIELILNAKKITYVSLTDFRHANETSTNENSVLLVNTTGELMNFFALSDIVFVGKSLADFKGDGGHNIIEPAIFGKAIICGPEMQNFKDIVSIFLNNNALVQVQSADELKNQIDALITDRSMREKYAKASRETVDKNRGAIKKTIALLTDG